MYADPHCLRVAEGWWRCGRQSFYFRVFESLSLVACLSLSLLTSTGNRAIRNVPIPQCPLKHLQMYSALICHSWECGGVSSYVPASTDGAAPPLREFQPAWGHPTPLLQFYTFRVMDNDDAVGLFSLMWQAHSRSFSCISFMCRLTFHRSVSYACPFNSTSECAEKVFLLLIGACKHCMVPLKANVSFVISNI